MKLYLHVGYPKTGTTAIQHFLYNNRECLKEAGYLYPDIGICDKAHHSLAISILEIDLPTTKHIRKYNPVCLRDSLVDSINSSKCKNVVISSEFFNLYAQSNFVRKKKTLVKFFKDYEITIILYLRHPIDFLESSYSQQIKNIH